MPNTDATVPRIIYYGIIFDCNDSNRISMQTVSSLFVKMELEGDQSLDGSELLRSLVLHLCSDLESVHSETTPAHESSIESTRAVENKAESIAS